MLLDGCLFQRLAAMIAREKNHISCCLTPKVKYLPKTATVNVRYSARVCVLTSRRRRHDDSCFGCVRFCLSRGALAIPKQICHTFGSAAATAMATRHCSVNRRKIEKCFINETIRSRPTSFVEIKIQLIDKIHTNSVL